MQSFLFIWLFGIHVTAPAELGSECLLPPSAHPPSLLTLCSNDLAKLQYTENMSLDF